MCIPGLGDSVVALPVELLRTVRIIGRVVIVVRAFKHLPIVESLSPLARDEVRASVRIHVPLSDVAGVEARYAQNLSNGHRLRVEGNVVEKDAVLERP